tara:strand:+ start:2696 stop:3559 length:864 start_codon:yes stop_codon:yes gene_type:complete
MSHISIFLELTRFKKPIGYMLLFWPCAWGLTIGYDFQNGINKFFFYLILFFIGSILMRSAGCIVNDIADKEFDKNVERTKNRPIASGKITVKLAAIYSIALCLLALLVLINFNFFTIALAMASMPLAFSYPLMKRFTYWPQLFLGITFNYGLILGWTSINEGISLIPLIFYFGAIFWTLGYDTIYGFQDIEDDEIIGVKSTSIKFKENPKVFLFICYFIFILSNIAMGKLLNLNHFYLIGILCVTAHLFIFQIYNFDKSDKSKCLKIFKSNNFLGFLILVNIIIGKF